MESDTKETNHLEKHEDERNIFGRLLDAVWQSDRDVIPYKLLYATIYGAGGCLIPYLPLYFKQLGFSAVETGILVSIRPLCLALISPLWGLLADRYQKRRYVLFMGALAWILKTMLILAVQPRHQECLVGHQNNSLSNFALSKSLVRGGRPLLDSNMLNRAFNWKMFTKKRNSHTRNKQIYIASPGFMKTPKTRSFEGKGKDFNISGRRFPSWLATEKDSKPSSSGFKASVHYSIYINKGEMKVIFYILVALTIFGEIFSAMLHPVADGCLIDCLGDQRSRYGRIRLWSSFVVSLGTLAIGLLINESTYYYCGQSRKDYRIAFYFFAALMTIGFVSIFCIKIVYCCKSSNQATFNGIRRLFTSLPKTAFWITSICLGILEGFQTEFTLWFLDDLGASSVIVGLAASLHYAFSAVVFFLTNYILDFLGYANTISLSLAVYAIIFACFAVIQAPWLGLILHALIGSAFAISWVPSVAYVGSKSSSAGLGASAQGNVTVGC